MPTHDPNSDFNGDGRSDILWRHEFYGVRNWLSGGGGSWQDNSVYSSVEVSPNWHIVGIGDFNGDSRDDLLWRHDDGRVHNWLTNSNGGFSVNASWGAGVPTDWRVAGVGDFDGDGKDDILWRHDSGLLATWLGRGDGSFTDNYLNSVVHVPTEWQIHAVGDFNGDGKDDVLWRHESGLVTNWLGLASGGFSQNYFNSVADVPLEWRVENVGDFNGDGRDDILWRHDSGVIADWLGEANGGFVNNYANSVAGVSPDWRVAQIGDFNGDGRDDILWQHAQGLTNFQASADGGFAQTFDYSVNLSEPGWHVQGDTFL